MLWLQKKGKPASLVFGYGSRLPSGERSPLKSQLFRGSVTQNMFTACVWMVLSELSKKRGAERVIWKQHEVKTVTPADRLRTDSYSSLMQAQTHPTDMHNHN